MQLLCTLAALRFIKLHAQHFSSGHGRNPFYTAAVSGFTTYFVSLILKSFLYQEMDFEVRGASNLSSTLTGIFPHKN